MNNDPKNNDTIYNKDHGIFNHVGNSMGNDIVNHIRNNECNDTRNSSYNRRINSVFNNSFNRIVNPADNNSNVDFKNNTPIILIAADQLRFDVLGKGYTPNLDELAGNSVQYHNAYCASPLCVPARGSLFTGLCPNSTGSLINPWESADASLGYVRKDIDHLYDILIRNGWNCLHSGKQHLFTEGGKLEERADSPIQWLSTEKTYREYLKGKKKRLPGGPRFRSPLPEMVSRRKTILTSCSNASTGCYEEGEDYYYDGYFTAQLLEGLRTRDTSRPLFLSAMFLAPHPPFDIPEPWYSLYSMEEIDIPENVGIFYPRQSPLQLYHAPGILGAHYTREEWRESWRVYLGLLSFLDHCVGQILSELKRQGIYEDSLILFTSDHGEMLGSHALFQKMCLYQEAVKIPLYIKLPHQTKGQTRMDNVSHIDIVPTLLEYLAIAPCNSMEGFPLPGISSSYHSRKDVPIYIQYDGNGSLSSCQRCIIVDNMKLIVDVFKDEIYFELYEIEKDVQETNNLIFCQDHYITAKKLFRSLLIHMQETKDSLQCTEDQLTNFLYQT